MNVESSTTTVFYPFFNNSVNIISTHTNGGKTSFLINVLKHRQLYFPTLVEGALIVLCNNFIEGNNYKELETDNFTVQIVYLDNFDLDLLQENYILIFEDVSTLSQVIVDCINIHVHHLNLASAFIVCQSVFYDKFRHLLSTCHNIIFSYSGSNGIRLLKYIVHYFCASDELKTYLSEICSISVLINTFVLLQLNQTARTDQPEYFAIVGIENLFKSDADLSQYPTLVFPQLNKKQNFVKMYEDNEAEVDDFDATQYPSNAYVLVPVKNVKKKNNSPSTSSTTNLETKWNNLNKSIREEIVTSNFKHKKQLQAFAIASKMLKNSDFLFSKDGTKVQIKDMPKTLVPIIDFLDVAARPSAPNEVPNPTFVLFVKTMRNKGAPLSIIKNKSLLYKMNKKYVIHAKQNKKMPQFGKNK
jgi:hypothetical protein